MVENQKPEQNPNKKIESFESSDPQSIGEIFMEKFVDGMPIAEEDQNVTAQRKLDAAILSTRNILEGLTGQIQDIDEIIRAGDNVHPYDVREAEEREAAQRLELERLHAHGVPPIGVYDASYDEEGSKGRNRLDKQHLKGRNDESPDDQSPIKFD